MFHDGKLISFFPGDQDRNQRHIWSHTFWYTRIFGGFLPNGTVTLLGLGLIFQPENGAGPDRLIGLKIPESAKKRA